MQTVLVASGTSQNKLNFATNFIETYLKEREIAADIIGVSIYEVDLAAVNPTVIVTIGPHDFTDEHPIVNGTAFITKISMEQCCEEILSYLNGT